MNTSVFSRDKMIFRCKTVFPFDFFPTVIEIDQEKVTIIYGLFFFTQHVVTILIEDLVNVRVTAGVLFSSVEFEIRYFENNPDEVRYMSRKDGLELRRIVTGLIEMHNKNTDQTSQMDPKQARKTARRTSKTNENI